MDHTQQSLLRTHLSEVYIGQLPPLLKPSTNAPQNIQKNISRALSAFALHQLCGAPLTDACASVVDDFGDLGIDAIFYNRDDLTLYLVQSKLKASDEFSQEEANGFCQGVRKLISCDFEGFNQNIIDRTAEIEDALDNCEKIQLVVAHLGDVIKQYPANAIADLIADNAHGEERFVNQVKDFSSSEILAALRGVHAHEHVNCNLQLQDWAGTSGSRKAYIGFAKLGDLARLHQLHGRALYAKNIRASLGHRTDVNIAIAETLAQEPAQFEFLNNGVTMLCKRIEGRRGSRDTKNFKIDRLSIVNGAQTVASAARFLELSESGNIDAARVLVTIIAADEDDEFGRSVTRSRNHQNTVKAADFTALDPEQERLRRELALLGIRYAYQAEAQDHADPATIRVEEAAHALAMRGVDPRLPVIAKRSSAALQMVGEYPYNAIFTGALSAYQIRNAVDVFRYIMTRMNQEASAAQSQQERLAYRHGAYVLAFILMKRFSVSIDGQASVEPHKLAAVAGPLLDSLRQRLWDEIQEFLAERGPLAIFRNQADVTAIIRGLMVADYGLKEDKALGPLLALNTEQQAYPERLFGYLSSKAPQAGDVT
ncbi:AIPR family protein [Caulobacter sp. Root487D2Y]|uniref:AIPR family protein n=1 Tax=Caulobacter sp. Root487D2Y TaxID=1736547 RepID=UPI0009EC3EA0|nr:AIPR family protein [Caulobacter sp. Root487D2Y]